MARDPRGVATLLGSHVHEGLWNLTPKALHNWQGFMIHAGDIIAKSGDVDADRLADVAARAASYADADPMNDAEIGSGPYSCTMCHGG